jgi:hypothetical protein
VKLNARYAARTPRTPGIAGFYNKENEMQNDNYVIDENGAWNSPSEAQEKAPEFIDLFQHMLDEIARCRPC